MRIILLGTDRTLFTEGSAVAKRLTAFGTDYTDRLDSIVFSTRAHGIRKEIELAPHVRAHPTNSFSRFVYWRDALRIANTLPCPDIVSAQDPFETGLAAYLIARHFNVPFAVEVHTDFLTPAFARHSLLNRFRVMLAGFVLRRAAGGYVVGERVANEINRTYGLSMPVLPIFVDLRKFHSVVRTPSRNSLLWVGRFEAEKNPMLALEAFAAVRRSGTDAKLTMLGAGHLEGEIKERARKLNIAEYVEFPGWVDIAPYLARTELMLVTSRYEGYGMAIVEALAAGVPVLATDVGIAREAGAIIAGEEYAKDLQSWLEGPRVSGALKLHLYANEGEYFARVSDLYMSLAKRCEEGIH